MTPEQRRILAKLQGRLQGHVVPAASRASLDTGWVARRVKFGVTLMVRTIGSYRYTQIWRDRDRLPLVGLTNNNHTRNLGELVKEFDRTVNAEMGRLLNDADADGRFRHVKATLRSLHTLEALLARYRISVK